MEDIASKLLLPSTLLPQGRPLISPDEVERFSAEGFSIEFEDNDSRVMEYATLRNGIVSVTTHRIIWFDDYVQKREKRCFCLPFDSISTYQQLVSLWKSPRLKIRVFTTSDGVLALDEEEKKHKIEATVALVCRAPKKATFDEFSANFSEAFQSKLWKTEARSKKSVPPTPENSGSTSKSRANTFNPAMAGISGIMRREQQQLEETDKNLSEAFSDMEALMAKAQEMVKLAEYMRLKLAARGTASNGADEFGGSEQEMQDWLLSIGIASPVTKESAGASYHKELAMELADFVMKGPLQKAGGMLAVVDAYCLINKARGTELISPDDLLRACAVWNSSNVPVRFKRFESGVAVIQHKEQSDEQIMIRIRDLVQGKNGVLKGITAVDLSKALGFAPALAKEQLLAAEMQGIVCRDDSSDGLQFYHNFFQDQIRV